MRPEEKAEWKKFTADSLRLGRKLDVFGPALQHRIYHYIRDDTYWRKLIDITQYSIRSWNLLAESEDSESAQQCRNLREKLDHIDVTNFRAPSLNVFRH